MKLRNKFISSGVSVIILGAVFFAGSMYGYSKRPAIEQVADLANKEEGKQTLVDFSPFWKAWNVINSKYVSNKDLNDQKMVWGSIEGLVKSLGDPYSIFFPPQE